MMSCMAASRVVVMRVMVNLGPFTRVVSAAFSYQNVTSVHLSPLSAPKGAGLCQPLATAGRGRCGSWSLKIDKLLHLINLAVKLCGLCCLR